MTRSLSQILREADEVIEKVAAETEIPQGSFAETGSDDLFKLAEEVRASVPAPTLSEPAPALELTEMEKVALAIAVVETAVSANELHALSKLEKTAEERDLSNESVQGFFDKVAEGSPVGKRAITFVEEASKYIADYCAAE